MSKNNIIIINGRHYDAVTGKLLDHAYAEHAGPAPRPAAYATPQPAAAHPAHTAVHGVRRATAHHAKPHTPAPARTLMRQAVKKPPVSARRRVRVSGRLTGQPVMLVQPSEAATFRPLAGRAYNHRPHHYEPKDGDGRLISHFAPDLFSVISHVPPAAPAPAAPKPQPQSQTRPRPAPQPPTTNDLLEFAVQHAPAPQAPTTADHRPRRNLLKRRQPAASHA